MTAYWEQNRCSVCSEPLDTEDEKDMGVHEGCETPKNVTELGPHEGVYNWARWSNNKVMPGYAGHRGCNA